MPSGAQVPSGIAAAAVIAAGIGCFVLGLLVTLAEASLAIKNALNWWNPVGPLSGKTSVAYAVWIISWIVLHQMFKAKQMNFGKAYVLGLVQIALGLLGTFPLFFERFTVPAH